MENTTNTGKDLATINAETNRIRLKLTRLIDRACEAFEDIVDNSEDDKARVAAAKEITGLWSKMHGLDVQAPAAGPTQAVQINITNLRDTLNSASLAMRRTGDVDAAISVAELTAELYEISPVAEPIRPAFEQIVDLTGKR